jgi:hypothetical protein
MFEESGFGEHIQGRTNNQELVDLAKNVDQFYNSTMREIEFIKYRLNMDSLNFSMDNNNKLLLNRINRQIQHYTSLIKEIDGVIAESKRVVSLVEREELQKEQRRKAEIEKNSQRFITTDGNYDENDDENNELNQTLNLYGSGIKIKIRK